MSLDIETAYAIQGYAYVVATGICVVLLYGYIYHLYSSEKKGTRDYEKYANIALDDEPDSKPIETTSPWEKKKNKGESV